MNPTYRTLPWVAQSCRGMFAAHATSESIRDHLMARRTELAALDREITWLEGLLVQREEATR